MTVTTTKRKRGGQPGHKGGGGAPEKPADKKRSKRVIFHVTPGQYAEALAKTPSGNVNEFARSLFLSNL